MPQTEQDASKVRFGLFEADLKTGELRRSGIRVRLQAQPFRVLTLLLERAGEVVSREELQQFLWGSDTVVDFEHSLGTAINKIRDALGDSADNPRFIETLARRGYRFIAPVTYEAEAAFSIGPALVDDVKPGRPAAQETSPTTRLKWSNWIVAGGLAGMIALLAAAFWVGESFGGDTPAPLEISRVTSSGRISPGDAFLENLPATATDGTRIYFPELENGRTRLAQALIADGEATALTLPDEIIAPLLADISPDGSELLIRNHVSAEVEQTLWVVPTLGGAGRQIASIQAHDATWMPDGQHILYASGNALYRAEQDGSGATLFAALPGRPFWMRWSPDGSLLRITLLDPANHTTTLWQLDANGRRLRALLPSWSSPGSECCGSWTPDGKDYVFQSAHSGESNLWMLQQHHDTPVQLTNGPLEYEAPITARTGHRIFFIGADTRSELLQYSSASKSFVPFGDSLTTANRVVFSRDGEWMAWISQNDSSLWRSRTDGTERIQLTGRPVEVFMMNWSPDSKEIVFMAREPGKQWQIYTVHSDGGNLQALLPEARNEADPDWSPDGSKIVFGRVPALMGEAAESKAIYLLDLKTGKAEMLPGSQDLFSPRWSPDGRYIAALSLSMDRVMLYDTATRSWRLLAQQSAADPVWSHDSRWLYFHTYVQKSQTIYRVNVSDGKSERVAALEDLRFADALDYQFAGLDPADNPLVSARMSTANIYTAKLPK